MHPELDEGLNSFIATFANYWNQGQESGGAFEDHRQLNHLNTQLEAFASLIKTNHSLSVSDIAASWAQLAPTLELIGHFSSAAIAQIHYSKLRRQSAPDPHHSPAAAIHNSAPILEESSATEHTTSRLRAWDLQVARLQLATLSVIFAYIDQPNFDQILTPALLQKYINASPHVLGHTRHLMEELTNPAAISEVNFFLSNHFRTSS